MSNAFVEWVVKFQKDIIQFFKFQFVSVIAYWADYAFFYSMYELVFLSNPIGYIYAKMMSYVVGLMTSYLINKRWTFEVKRQIFSKYLLKFIIVNLAALTANLTAMYILTTYYGIIPQVSQLLATVFSFSINYSGNKIWVFEDGAKRC